MTYNMTIERADEIDVDEHAVNTALAEVHAAGHRMHAAIGRHDYDQLLAAMQTAIVRLYEASPTEFELTAGSMTDALNAMDRLGMLATHPDGHLVDAAPTPFPRQQDFGVEPDMWDYAEGDEVPAPIVAFEQAFSAVSDAQAEKPNGIPLYKLRTNDLWLVTPDEIRAALVAHLEAGLAVPAVPEPDYFWWPHWLAFLELAAEHGGIRVR